MQQWVPGDRKAEVPQVRLTGWIWGLRLPANRRQRGPRRARAWCAGGGFDSKFDDWRTKERWAIGYKKPYKICVCDMRREGARRADADYRYMDALMQHRTQFTMNEVMIEATECGHEL